MSNLSRETARKLKDAGFPQSYEPICLHQVEMAKKGLAWGGYNAMVHMRTCDRPGACVPNLSELIEACGKEFYSVVRMGSAEFKAFSSVDGDNTIASETASTPEEATANLWLALYSKHAKARSSVPGALQ